MIKFKEKKKDRISVIENSIDNILDTLKNLADTQEDIIKIMNIYVINLIRINIEFIPDIQRVVQYFNYD